MSAALGALPVDQGMTLDRAISKSLFAIARLNDGSGRIDRPRVRDVAPRGQWTFGGAVTNFVTGSRQPAEPHRSIAAESPNRGMAGENLISCFGLGEERLLDS